MRDRTRLADQLPAFTLKDAQVAEHLTVRDILSHRVGLPRNAFDPLLEQDEPYPVLASRLSELPSVCHGDACYGYQNVAFSLIGDMIFAVTGLGSRIVSLSVKKIAESMTNVVAPTIANLMSSWCRSA